MDNDFWSGVRLMVNGLVDAAKKASYSLGFGAGGFGIALALVSHFGIVGPASLLISISAFFILARLGKALDDRIDHFYFRRLKTAERDTNGQEHLFPSDYPLTPAMKELQHRLAVAERLQQEYKQLLREVPDQLREIEKQNNERMGSLNKSVLEIRKQLAGEGSS